MASKLAKNLFQNKRERTSALTLVELLIYVAIFAIVAGLFVSILTTTVQSNNQEVAANEVTGQLNFVLSTVQRLVQNSSQVEVYASLAQSTSTNATTTGSFLKIRTNSTSTDPTCVYLSSGTVWETTGPTPNASSTCNLSNAVALTTSKVVA
ncbi:MAG TPA: type II secretion system protein, partial [Candidatus Tyrphobacter sp.]|nr:type II secretion system protein [Candidatus Tyrphobacter sp.]